MGCSGCGKSKRTQRNERRQKDHAAMEKLRSISYGDSTWYFNGEALVLVKPGENVPQMERYGDPADAINYWAED